MNKQPSDGYRQRMQTLQTHAMTQQQSLRDRVRQVQEWTLAHGFLQGGLDADSYRVRREQVQQTQQQMERLRQLAQRQGQGY